jgi:Concanavalin A-like lectin/glucanases superfamily
LAACAAAVKLPAQTCISAPAGLSGSVTFDEPRFRSAPNRITGIVGKAMRFDGKGQFEELADSRSFQVGDADFSVELWVRTTAGKSIRNLVDFRNDKPQGWTMFIQQGKPGFQVADGGAVIYASSTTPIADGRWHHVVAIAKRLPPQPSVLWVDNAGPYKSPRNVPLSSLDHSTPLWLARHHRNIYVNRDEIYFQGDLDEIALYRRALTPTDIAALYRAGRAGKCKK